MRKRLVLATLAIVAVGTFAGLPLAASADDEGRVVIGVRYNLIPGTPLTGVGTWAACCAINDGGATNAVVNVTSVKNDTARIAGTHTFTSPQGTFTDSYTGTLGPVSGTRQIAEGHWRIVSGTGIYAHARGSGTFVDVVDGPTGTATGVHDGHIRLSGDGGDH
jgi:hypothetical protein